MKRLPLRWLHNKSRLSQMVWHFIGVYLINNSRVENISRARAANEWNIFQHLKRNFVSPRGQEISSMYSYGCMVCEHVCELLTHWKSQQNRSGKVAIIQKLNWQEDHWYKKKGSTFRWKRQSWAKTLKNFAIIHSISFPLSVLAK